MKGIDNLISKLGIPDELQAEIHEAWGTAVKDNKAEALREAKEGSKKEFDGDIQTMITAAESLIKETLESELREFKEDRKKVYEAKKALLSNLRKARTLKENQEAQVKKRVVVFENFVMETLKGELSEFQTDRKSLRESVQTERLKLKKERIRQRKLSESKEKAMNNLVTSVLRDELGEFSTDRKNMLENINKMENLVISQVTQELGEFQQDRQKLKEKHSELENDYKKKLTESKQAYVKQASKAAEALVNETIREELTTLKEDIHQAKENTFGRKLFEAFASEFYNSHLAENTEVHKMGKKLEESSKNVEKLRKILKKQDGQLNKTSRLLKETRENSKREQKIAELVKPLPSIKQKMMRSLLESIEAKDLDKTFERYLPSLLESSSKPSGTKKVISENKKSNSYKEFTGQRNNERVKKPVNAFESQEQDEFQSDINKIFANAGIRK